MGRRRLWILISIALVVGIVLLVAVLKPLHSFRFLEGRSPVMVRRNFGMRGLEEFYSWQADGRTVVDQATTELTALSFKPDLDGSLFVRDLGEGQKDIVSVIVDAKMTGPLPPNANAGAKGWVIVVVTMEPRSIWDRIKAVFGL